MRLFRLVCITFVALLLGGCDPAATRLTIVTPVESVDRSIVEDLEGILARNSALQARLAEQALSESDALDAVASGRADLALVSNYLPFRDDVATAQLIDEKLAADESFRILITLSNDVLAEMREAPS